MMLLFFDCETSGLVNKNKPLEDPSQPWAVTMAADLCDMEGNSIDFFHLCIRADDRRISAGAERVHGITSRKAAMTGVPEIIALGCLIGLANQATHVIGHGIQFDKDVITGLLLRRQKETKNWLRPGIQWECTMKMATPFCQIQREDGSIKWPSLDEACQILLGMPARTGNHSAFNDIQRTKRLYFELARRGVAEAQDGKPFTAPADDQIIAQSPQLAWRETA